MSNYNQFNQNVDDSVRAVGEVSHELVPDYDEAVIEGEANSDNLSFVGKDNNEVVVDDKSQDSEILDPSDSPKREQGTSQAESNDSVNILTLSKLDVLLETQQQLIDRLNLLSAQFNSKIMHTNHEEKIVDQMHKELQKYKDDLYAQLVRPILLDVIEVRDSILRMSAVYLSKPEGEKDIPIKVFSDYSYDLQDILEKNQVEIYMSKVGDEFIPVKQRVVKKVKTHIENLHGKIAESLSNGYSYNGRTISPEKIIVYSYERDVQEKENSEVTENG